MQLSLTTATPSKNLCRKTARANKTPEEIPDHSALLTTLLPSSSLSARPVQNDVDCLTTACPKCNKRSLVRRSTNIFDCLNCNFHKQLPPIKANRRLSAPTQSAISSGAGPTGIYGLSNTGFDSSSLENRTLGQGSLSRLLESDSDYLGSNHTEADSAQPLLFAAIAVIIGILIL